MPFVVSISSYLVTHVVWPGARVADSAFCKSGSKCPLHPLLRVLTDRGTEYCGNRECQEYQLYLAGENIDHSRTKAKSPQTNGICERFNRTLQEEFYSVAFRKKLYRSLDELQSDLDVWLGEYNEKREHSGKYGYGKTPWQTFLDSKHLAQAKMLDSLTATISPDVEEQRAEPERSPAQPSGGGAQGTAA